MAEYRSGHFAEADAALIAAAESGMRYRCVVGSSLFYRVMSLFRQGKENDARQLATEAAAKMRPLPKDEKNPLADNADYDDLILWMAYKEARSLIKFETAPRRPEAGRQEMTERERSDRLPRDCPTPANRSVRCQSLMAHRGTRNDGNGVEVWYLMVSEARIG